MEIKYDVIFPDVVVSVCASNHNHPEYKLLVVTKNINAGIKFCEAISADVNITNSSQTLTRLITTINKHHIECWIIKPEFSKLLLLRRFIRNTHYSIVLDEAKLDKVKQLLIDLQTVPKTHRIIIITDEESSFPSEDQFKHIQLRNDQISTKIASIILDQ